MTTPTITCISAITLATRDMPRAVGFYRALGFALSHGGEDASFTSFHAGSGFLNLIAQPRFQHSLWWGRVIFYVSDVDAMYARANAQGLSPEAAPRDAEWGERYFHLRDPDAHELSFAEPLRGQAETHLARPSTTENHRHRGRVRSSRVVQTFGGPPEINQSLSRLAPRESAKFG